jgi:excisionase family DNA binding protein
MAPDFAHGRRAGSPRETFVPRIRIPESTWVIENGGRLLTLQEVADYLQVHPRTVRRRIALDGFPCVRIGKQLRFYAIDVHRWVSARKGE